MPRNQGRETTCDLPRFLADDIKDLIETDRTPARNMNEYVRQAVAKQVAEDKQKPPRASGPVAAAADSSFAAESANEDTRASQGIARGNRRSVPGFDLTPDAVGAEDAGGN